MASGYFNPLTGYMTLADDGVRHIIEGVTSIKEVARVADLTERMG